MGKLTINLCEELHQKIREDVAADESLTTSLLMERIIREHYEGPKPRPRIESGGRTMAFSVSEELFQRVKRYLAAHGGQSQRDFVIGLVTQGLALWEQGKALKMLEGYTPQKGDRTLAFAVTEELFHQIKAYLAAHKKLSQKEFMVSLVENAVSAWEAGAEADGSPIVEVLPELTEEDKAKLKADAKLGYTCTWALSEIYADTEIPPTLTPNTYTIKFEANGSSGMMPDESYAYDKIQTTDSLPPNKFTTFTFKGWALTATDAEKYADGDSIQSIVNFMAMENKTKLTLYAVWEDTAAGGETVEP